MWNRGVIMDKNLRGLSLLDGAVYIYRLTLTFLRIFSQQKMSNLKD